VLAHEAPAGCRHRNSSWARDHRAGRHVSATTPTHRDASIGSLTAADRIPERGGTVSILNKIRHKAQMARGKAKKSTGRVTGNRRLRTKDAPKRPSATSSRPQAKSRTPSSTDPAAENQHRRSLAALTTPIITEVILLSGLERRPRLGARTEPYASQPPSLCASSETAMRIGTILPSGVNPVIARPGPEQLGARRAGMAYRPVCSPSAAGRRLARLLATMPAVPLMTSPASRVSG